MFYEVDFASNDRDPLQARLNEICDYANDVETKVLHRARMNLFFLLVQDLIRQKVITEFGRALDIGCNTGIYSKIISDFGFAEVLGLDIVPEMIEKATRTFGSPSTTFRLQNAEELDPARDGLFDFILCTEVIEHTARPEKVVENIRALLTPRGVAVVTLPNAWSLPYQVANVAYRLFRKPRNAEFEDHMKFPVGRSLRLVGGNGGGTRIARTDGTSLLLETHLLHALYGTPLFAPFNRLQFALARTWPLKYFAQFFFMVLVRRDRPEGGGGRS